MIYSIAKTIGVKSLILTLTILLGFKTQSSFPFFKEQSYECHAFRGDIRVIVAVLRKHRRNLPVLSKEKALMGCLNLSLTI